VRPTAVIQGSIKEGKKIPKLDSVYLYSTGEILELGESNSL
jgi:hypothetical protein